MNRRNLIDALIELNTDEFDPNEVIYKDDEELVDMIISCAFYYKDELNK